MEGKKAILGNKEHLFFLRNRGTNQFILGKQWIRFPLGTWVSLEVFYIHLTLLCLKLGNRNQFSWGIGPIPGYLGKQPNLEILNVLNIVLYISLGVHLSMAKINRLYQDWHADLY